MKLGSFLLGVAAASDCGDITTAPGFMDLLNNGVKLPSCARTEGTSCKIQCMAFHALHTLESKITATCKNGGWNFGKYGSGDNKATPKFGCCLKQITSYGKAFAKSKTNRKYGFKFVEADATQALMAHQIKMKNTANAGYSFMLAFEAVVPADIVFETFARFEVVSRYDDEKTNQTLVMLASKVGHDNAAEKERFDLTFMMRSSGATNVKDFVEATDYTVRQYADRATHWCPGNEAIDNMLQPVPTTFSSFNIQVFGQTKYAKTVVKDQIIEILRRYDISTIQEIRDSAETAFPNLVADMNAVEDIYDFHVGARQGSSSSKEQEGFVWDRTKFAMHDAYDFVDTDGWFERPPTIVYFNSLNENNQVQKFMIISTHIKPVAGSTDMTTEDEINHLQQVYEDAIVRQPDYTDAIIAGDMNADCTYVKTPEELTLFTDPTSLFLLPFNSDTTVKDTDCAYDHIVLKGDNMQAAWSNPGVFNYQTHYNTDEIFYTEDGEEPEAITHLVSDHFPVEFTFA